MTTRFQPQVHYPPPSERYDLGYMSRLLEAIRASVTRRLSSETANDSILLLSPGGKVYKVSVSDAGALTSTLVQG